MRTTKKGESIVTLDKKERQLPEGAMVLSDDEGIFDLLGIMGGLRSSTKESTRKVYLHSASLDSVSIRNAVVATGLRTDAATVYEKGVPHITAEQGFYRAIQLFLELVPGARIASAMDSQGNNGSPKPIQFSLERASGFLGRKIEKKEAEAALAELGFGIVVSSHSSTLSITTPLHRIGDIHNTSDLTEEIARISGLSNIKEEMPSASIAPPNRDRRINKLRRALSERGFTEVVQFAFLGIDLLKKAGLDPKHLEEIKNPLGEDIKYMRPDLLPRLLQFAEENIKLVDGALSTFEVGHIFPGDGEKKMLTLLIANKRDEGLMREPFLLVKAAATEMISLLNVSCDFSGKRKTSSEMHPGRAMSIKISRKNVGSIFEVHPAVTKAFGLPGRVAAATIDLGALLESRAEEKMCEDIFEFPSITYDTTISLSAQAEAGPLLEKVRKAHEFLRDVQLVDLYQGKESRQLTVRCTYNAGSRTLTEEEVKPVHEKVEKLLTS